MLIGDMVYIEALGSRFVILNSAKIAKDLLVTRSTIYSNRPHLVSHCLIEHFRLNKYVSSEVMAGDM